MCRSVYADFHQALTYTSDPAPAPLNEQPLDAIM